MLTNHTTQLQVWLDLARGGDEGAKEFLISATCTRLRRLTHSMLAGDRVRRWEQTDDVLQIALLRLHRDLQGIDPQTLRDFLRLAAFQIRRVLIELARHYYGPCGLGTNCLAPVGGETEGGALGLETPDRHASASQGIATSEGWQRLHQAVDTLPVEEREIVDLLWFHEFTQIEAARLLNVDVRTVQRRWQRARLRLFDALNDEAVADRP